MKGFYLIHLVLLSFHSRVLSCSLGLHKNGCFASLARGRLTTVGQPELQMTTRNFFFRDPGLFNISPFKFPFDSAGIIRFWRRDTDCAVRCSSEVPMACPSQDIQVCQDSGAICSMPTVDNGQVTPANITFKDGDSAIVSCDDGYTFEAGASSTIVCQNNGTWDQIPTCHDFDECQSNPCQNGAVCNNYNGGYNCSCQSGWHGINCETDINECDNNLCENSAACYNFNGGYRCVCELGWQGVNCETDVNECVSNPCLNEGVCNNYDGGYNCTCGTGWQDKNCQTDFDECQSNPCQNGAVCNNYNGGYNCSCQSGWQGINCETDINECENNPCENSAACYNFNGGYRCVCELGWQGVNCETDFDECQSNPCQNGAVCINYNGGYNCSCQSGWQGINCETDVNECDFHPCQNEGVCTNYNGGYICICQGGWPSVNCERESQSEDGISLHCLEHVFRVVIPGKLLINQSESVRLNDNNCVGRREPNGDVIVESHYDSCGTIQEVDNENKKIIYKNIVSDVVASRSFATTSPIHVNIEVECLFDQDRLVSTNYALVSSLRQSLSQTGEYDVSFSLYTDDTFSEVQRTPVFVEEPGKIFLRVQLETEVSGLSMLGTRCWATPTDKSDDDRFTNLIENGCPVGDHDVKIESHLDPTSKPSFAFSASLLQFAWRNVVYVHCNTRICNASDIWDCQPFCGSRLPISKRSSGLTLSRRFSQGPIIKDMSTHSSEVTWPLPAVATLCALSVLTTCWLSLVGVKFVLRRNTVKSTGISDKI